MDNALRRLALLFALALPCHAQGILAPILFGHGAAAPSGSNISYVGQTSARHDDAASTDTTSVTYTCQSTSNQIILFVLTGSGGNSITMSDTGGEITGATTLLSGELVTSPVYYLALNVGCASGANTITATTTGLGAFVNMSVDEYSGITSGKDGSGAAVYTASGTTCSAAATASQAGDLAVAYTLSASTQAWTAQANGFTTRTRTGGVAPGPITYGSAAAIVSDNLYAPSGTVTYAPVWGTTSGSFCFLVLIPGTAATSPAFYPNVVQSYHPCSLTGTNPTFAQKSNVTSGDLIIAGFYDSSTATPSSITDTLGTIYTARVTKTSGSNEVIIYTGVPTSTGANTLTANGSGFNAACMDITEIAGPTGTVTDTGGLTTSATTMTWSQTVTNAKSLVYAICTQNAANTSFTINTPGFSLTSSTGGLQQSGIGAWARALSSGSVSPSFTMGGSHNNIGASIVVQ